MSGPWSLAVDFGTSNTAAAACPVGEPHRARAIKLASASTEMPSAVLAHRDGRLLVGEVALHSAAAAEPDAYEPNPKSRVGEGQVLLGGRTFTDVSLVAAVLAGAASRAARQFGGVPPAELRLTHPASWARHRVEVLFGAALEAGLPRPALVPEPVAAAAYYSATHDGPASDLPLAVYDIGGGTVDVAVLHRSNGGFRIDAVHGVDPLGGNVFDQRLLSLVHESLTHRGRAGLRDRFEGPGSAGRRRTLLDEVRRAKHSLSEESSADVAVPSAGDVELVTLTRTDFESSIRPDLKPSLAAVRSALGNAGTTTDRLGALYLVGGSSFVPLVARMLTEDLGVVPATFDDPKTITAVGALHVRVEAERPDRTSATPRVPVEGPRDRDRGDAETSATPVLRTTADSDRDVIRERDAAREPSDGRPEHFADAAAALLVVAPAIGLVDRLVSSDGSGSVILGVVLAVAVAVAACLRPRRPAAVRAVGVLLAGLLALAGVGLAVLSAVDEDSLYVLALSAAATAAGAIWLLVLSRRGPAPGRAPATSV